MEQSIDLILREIERSDNEKMRYKKDIMIDFIKERFFELPVEEDIIRAYSDYEKERLNLAIEEFSTETGIDKEKITKLLTQYFINEKSITNEKIRKELDSMDLGLIKMTKLIKSLFNFIQDMYNKFTSEGE